jgi:hypothetical protein
LTFWTRHSDQVRDPIDDYDQKRKEKVEAAAAAKGEDHDEGEEHSCLRFLKCICGGGAEVEEGAGEDAPKLSQEEEAAAAAKFLDEDKFWKRLKKPRLWPHNKYFFYCFFCYNFRFVNSSGVLVVTASVFMWAYYA